MTYEIKLSDTARASLKIMDRQMAKRIIDKLEKIKGEPFTYVKRLIGVSLYSLRVGDYRIIMSIDNSILLIFVVRIGHRRDVYKRI